MYSNWNLKINDAESKAKKTTLTMFVYFGEKIYDMVSKIKNSDKRLAQLYRCIKF